MFGYIRFTLAFLVMLSHINVRWYGLNPGVIAVVIFYILAGYVVSHLFNDTFKNTHQKLKHFYIDRVIRIFPLYLYTVALTIIFLWLTSFGAPQFTLKTLVANLTIMPLNYYMYYDITILKEPQWWLIPPAWSLATELHAYVLLPLALMHKRIKIILVIGSFVIYTIANYTVLHPDYFGYRFIVGVFFMFFIGAMIQQAKNAHETTSRVEALVPWFFWIATIVLAIAFTLKNNFSPTYTKETLIGLFVGIPLVYCVSRLKINLPFNTLLASLSYGIFLTHFLAVWILEYVGLKMSVTLSYISLLTILSLFMAYIGIVYVENPLRKWRYPR